MSRTQQFKETTTYTVQTDSGSGPTLQFQSMELVGEPTPDDVVDVVVKTTPSHGGETYYLTVHHDGEKVFDVEIDVQPDWGGAERSHRFEIDIPSEGDHELVARGGIVE